MSTAAQILANSANSVAGIGLGTAEGKSASCQNAVFDGFAAADPALLHEDNGLLEALRRDFDPPDADQNFLVSQIAAAQ